MTDTDAFLLEFYDIVEKIDSNEFIKLNIMENMKEVCALFRKYGICENKEGKEEEL